MTRTMKDSGIEWIGNIPVDWKVGPVKHLFFRKNEKAMQDDPIILSLARSGVKVRDITTNEGQMAESYFNYNPVIPGDLLLNPMDLYSGANCSISKVSGVISPAYINLGSKHDVSPTYYDYFFKTQYWSMVLFAHGKGVSFDNRWTLGQETLMNYKLPIPCYSEQQRIASFLDSKCQEIDNVLAKTRSSIEEYKKLKQAIITKAVTKGIRTNRKMKNTGIKWIGEIPEEWGITTLSRCASIKSGITLGRVLDAKAEVINLPYLRVANVQNGYVDTTDLATITVTIEEAKKYSLKKGCVLMTEGGDRDKLGRGTVWDGSVEPCLHQNHIFAVITNALLDEYFLEYLTTSNIGRIYFDITAIKTTNLACTNSSKVSNFKFPLPSLKEQKEIVTYIKAKCNELDTLISKKEQLIIELEAYKKSLIYEYVTGKKEVFTA